MAAGLKFALDTMPVQYDRSGGEGLANNGEFFDAFLYLAR